MISTSEVVDDPAKSDALAIYLPDGHIAPPANPYGRLIANAGVYRSLARYGGYRSIHFLCRTPTDPSQLAQELGSGPGLQISSGSLLATTAAAQAGTLLSGQPYLEEPAWARRYARRDADYSIVGTIFAFASATHREQMMRSTLAPLHEWDALICSSPTLAQTVARTFDEWEDHLRERLLLPDPHPSAAPMGPAFRLPRPQLPVIPFGTDVDKLAAQSTDAHARAQMRGALGISDDDVMVLFLGRLSYYDKAFPQAMFRTVAEAQRRTGVTTHLVLTGWFPGGDADRARFSEVADIYAPDVTTTFLDGNDDDVVASCWAAADVFLLLSDTILETFGQALVEAMAAGLPLVVSDWDGYRCIVRDGVEGFRIPTLGAPGGTLGQTLALLQSVGDIGYPQYAGAVAAHTAVHVPRAVTALSQLIESPELRARMGQAAATRARELYSWPVVTAQYSELFAELTERRIRPAPNGRVTSSRHRLNPLRADPFVEFHNLPTGVLSDDSVIRLASINESRSVLTTCQTAELDQMFSGLRGGVAEAEEVITTLQEAGELRVSEILTVFLPRRRPYVRMTIMWLAKAGVVDWLPDEGPVDVSD